MAEEDDLDDPLSLNAEEHRSVSRNILQRVEPLICLPQLRVSPLERADIVSYTDAALILRGGTFDGAQ